MAREGTATKDSIKKGPSAKALDRATDANIDVVLEGVVAHLKQSSGFTRPTPHARTSAGWLHVLMVRNHIEREDARDLGFAFWYYQVALSEFIAGGEGGNPKSKEYANLVASAIAELSLVQCDQLGAYTTGKHPISRDGFKPEGEWQGIKALGRAAAAFIFLKQLDKATSIFKRLGEVFVLSPEEAQLVVSEGIQYLFTGLPWPLQKEAQNDLEQIYQSLKTPPPVKGRGSAEATA